MAHRIIKTPEAMMSFLTFFEGMKLPLTVEWRTGADRTRDQNSLQWLWAGEVARQLCDEPAEVQAEWKLEVGVPILRGDSAEFRDIYDEAIRPLPYERKKALMKVGFPVTSQMKVRQMVRYLDAVERRCLEAGLQLTEPDPELASYNRRYRQKEAA